MELLVNTIRNEVESLNKNNIRLHVIGDMNMLPDYARKELNEALDIYQRKYWAEPDYGAEL